MLIPKEKPYMDGLSSYYLDTLKFIEHLQGEIGNGCIYLKSSVREILIYFDEMDIINGVIQEPGKPAEVAPNLQPIFELLQQRNYLVKVFRFDPNAIFFWAQMPPYKRSKTDLTTDDISLSDLIERLHQDKASCFVEMNFGSPDKSCLLFFHEGDYIGASCAWGTGGLNTSRQELTKFIELTRSHRAVLTLGHFENSSQPSVTTAARADAGDTPEPPDVEDQVFISNLPTILEELFALYISAVKKKVRVDPVSLLEQRLVLRTDDFPFLDPFNLPFEYTDSVFTFTGSDNAFGENIARAVIECAWDVVEEYNVQKKFRNSLAKWAYRPVLEERGYAVVR